MSVGAAALLLAAAAPPVPPRPAPPAFATDQYGLTFRTPRGTSYCPLPADWVGSDHGTTLFLLPPQACAGDAGYPSSGRGFRPAGTPRVEVFYHYDMGEDEAPPRACHGAAFRLLGRRAGLCRTREAGLTAWTATARYPIDRGSDGRVSLTLLTTPARAARDLASFRALLASVATCSSEWRPQDAAGRPTGERFTTGTGPRCPADARFF